MGTAKRGREADSEQQRPVDKRSWRVSVAVAAAIVGVGIWLSATVNPLFGRYVHWDWMAIAAPALVVALTVALRKRWV